MGHLVWDWNGTLLDDLDLVVSSVNFCIVEYGRRPIDANDYREHYTRPVSRFYEHLLDRPLSPAEFAKIDETFHQHYLARLTNVPLVNGALDALRTASELGWSQSLLSMFPHADLLETLRSRQLDQLFLGVDGWQGDQGDRKAAHLARHLQQFRLDPTRVVLIGDVLDDAEAAVANGVPCVLFDGGSHHRHQLDRLGHPVASTLLEAVELAARYLNPKPTH